MDAHELLRQAVFTNQSPAAAEYIQERLSSCFSADPTKSQLSIHSGRGTKVVLPTETTISDVAGLEANALSKGIVKPANSSVDINNLEDLRTFLQVPMTPPAI
jgi:hypothetical protein